MNGTSNMKNYAKSEKSRGICAFAVNTDKTDYVKIATQTLKLASRVLGIPYTVIEINPVEKENLKFDIDLRQSVQWNNQRRYKIFDLSPYDETLVIDADYLVFDRHLNSVFELDWDYLLTRHCRTIGEPFSATMGPHSIPYVWATVFAFRKTKKTELFFDLIRRIEDNYSYYHRLFNISEMSNNFRNDYAFAIADTILNGYTVGTSSMPGKLLNVNVPVKSIEDNGNQLIIRTETQAHVVPKMNLHLMSKQFLQSTEFENFLKNV